MATDRRRLALGSAALGIGSVLIIAMSFRATPLPDVAAAVASLAIAAGALLVGLSQIDVGV
mgnify:CR=1 FL=1